MNLTLYSTPLCHLCDQAKAIIDSCALAKINLDVVDIVHDAELTRRYGTCIPVVRDGVGGRELCWPFDDDDFIAWLSGLT